MSILETDRLVVRQLTLDDAAFILELLNEPPFIKFIGDRGVRTLDDAREYLRNGPLASYAKHGFGLWLVALKDTGESVGICGLLKRETLEHPDIGFAFLQRFMSKGYGFESASAVLGHGRRVLKLDHIVAITAPENPASFNLLRKLGFRFDRMIALPGREEPSRLFVPEA